MAFHPQVLSLISSSSNQDDNARSAFVLNSGSYRNIKSRNAIASFDTSLGAFLNTSSQDLALMTET